VTHPWISDNFANGCDPHILSCKIGEIARIKNSYVPFDIEFFYFHPTKMNIQRRSSFVSINENILEKPFEQSS